MGWKLTESHDSPHGEVRWASFGEGSPVVLLHGTPFSSYVWRDVAAGLATRHRVYVWDMPGYGLSEKRAGQDVSLAAQQEVFTGLLEHWGLRSPAVVAHDFGGAVSLRSALLDGVRYERFVLVDAVSLRPWGSGFFRLVHDNADVFEALPPHLHEALVRRYIATAAHHELPPPTLDALTEPWLGETGQPAFYRQIAQADERHTQEVEDRYGDLDCPVLIAWGREDSWLPAERGTRLGQQIPGARLELIDDAGHLVQEDAPAHLTGLLADFLAR
ncbi:pimeloyl-ACP methyl ester carboxylesterase [Saccharopolyspora erythraea NRRL 2338]|uniref:Oxidoreductase n=2 Tax=Saccharopolyspora erythraea TaxID=1836 RepID=A4FK07_SACEN|nr:alpha/beta hydrolase [Saccharopolyspora erythraea]EQD86964.1 alpha/beta hydrolase [Saccharopolyspora erythraea D]PFG98020.1 pimeloyl-ACP methyl ester carboxylesterase [Saccharopolyspora erythraea NRRL 2338]QRK88140.1 alpha/beta hydrolase [Saccharopolyspora erythraea]CAM04382.1 oxidoreductase [Saccharopolyspora erythraea NRRL 2338]